MLVNKLNGFFLLLIALGNSHCKKSYAPPEINANHLFLTVYGLINTGSNSVSSFKLTRSQNLSDTVAEIPELGATVLIQGSDGNRYPLVDTGSHGNYMSDPLSLDATKKFTLLITTSDGEQYQSDPVTPKSTPPIDSLTWTLGMDGAANTQAVNIYLNTHDPTNNTRFYRWDFTETWEHDSKYKIFYIVENKKIVYESDLTKHNWYCWSSDFSTNVLIGNSANLSADRIDQAPIARILQNDSKMDIKYSILVRQYAMDAAAYDYWILVQKNSQSLGGLFDIQPAQFTGNVHNLTIPSEPVYGYVSASSVQEKRIFISNDSLPGWKSPTLSCQMFAYPPQKSILDYDGTDPNITFYAFDTINIPPNQILIETKCMDCTYQGGTTTKPPFWQ